MFRGLDPTNFLVAQEVVFDKSFVVANSICELAMYYHVNYAVGVQLKLTKGLLLEVEDANILVDASTEQVSIINYF